MIVQGALAYIRFSHRSCSSRRGGGRRGKITRFSPAARRRLLKFLHRILWRMSLFITLTVHQPISHKEAKRRLRAFLQWLREEYPLWGFIWKMEYQERGVVHFHLLGIPPDWVKVPRIPIEDISRRWALGFCWIERVPVERIRWYLIKYVGKGSLDTGCISAERLEDLPGRFWGRIGRIELAKPSFDLRYWLNSIILDSVAGLIRWADRSGVLLRGYVGVLLPVQCQC